MKQMTFTTLERCERRFSGAGSSGGQKDLGQKTDEAQRRNAIFLPQIFLPFPPFTGMLWRRAR
jgi:hypothetical protein